MEAKVFPFDLALEEDLAGTEGTEAVDFFLPRTEALDSGGLIGVGLDDSLGVAKAAFLEEEAPGLEEPVDLEGARPEVFPDLDAGLDAIEFSWKGFTCGT